MKIHQLSLFLENTPGALVEPCRLVSEAGIDVRTLTLADTERFGILRMIVSDWEKGKALLQAAGFVVNVVEVVAVEVPDRPGGLTEILSIFGAGGGQHRIHVCVSLRTRQNGGSHFPLRQARRRDRPAPGARHQRRGERGGLQQDPGMIVANVINQQLERASWIRRMFEVGLRLKAERGEENVFDFTLGNPNEDPPPEVLATLRRVAAENRPGMHGYMPNAGFPAVRRTISERLRRETGLDFTTDHVLMTVGSAGAINTVLKAMLDPGDEVIVPLPCFSEYPFYVANHGGALVTVETCDDFSLDVARVGAAITDRTRALILNSPHNPTGVVYSEAVLRELEALLRRVNHTVVVIVDEPYKAFVYDGAKVPVAASIISSCVVASSWSKTWAIAGERIGYLAISPRLPGADELRNACTFTNRILGFINAPAIWQWVVAEAPEVPPELHIYQEKRDLLCDGLARAGYEVRKPQGAFYLFLKTPVPDDIAFVRLLQSEGVLAVPGTGFGRGGYIRLSLTVSRDTVVRSLPGFARALEKSHP